LSEYAKRAPPLDYSASFDSLDMMKGVMRHFNIRALIEQRQGVEVDWDKVDNLMRRVLTAASAWAARVGRQAAA